MRAACSRKRGRSSGARGRRSATLAGARDAQSRALELSRRRARRAGGRAPSTRGPDAEPRPGRAGTGFGSDYEHAGAEASDELLRLRARYGVALTLERRGDLPGAYLALDQVLFAQLSLAHYPSADPLELPGGWSPLTSSTTCGPSPRWRAPAEPTPKTSAAQPTERRARLGTRTSRPRPFASLGSETHALCAIASARRAPQAARPRPPAPTRGAVNACRSHTPCRSLCRVRQLGRRTQDAAHALGVFHGLEHRAQQADHARSRRTHRSPRRRERAGRPAPGIRRAGRRPSAPRSRRRSSAGRGAALRNGAG